ncbi:hypothetical protein [Mycobacterium lepromatosis]|uniref:hypothetical protein n=1 Tax=Mycobacterium lepromatosis TaxID=480418 RepID=UPI0012E089EA|nr:hypothetical protein [Mycobacterium lepromatosis]
MSGWAALFFDVAIMPRDVGGTLSRLSRVARIADLLHAATPNANVVAITCRGSPVNYPSALSASARCRYSHDHR